jgi:hypothetical protein
LRQRRRRIERACVDLIASTLDRGTQRLRVEARFVVERACTAFGVRDGAGLRAVEKASVFS